MYEDELERQQRLYWNKMLDLRTAADYIRLYRNYTGRWVTRVAVVRAVASSVSIAGWAIWHRFAFIWALVIALSQVLDALREVFPMTRRHKVASEYSVALEALFIDAQRDWEGILAGKYSADAVMELLHSLRGAHHTIESKIIREDLPDKDDLFRIAELDADVYLSETYGVESKAGGRLNG